MQEKEIRARIKEAIDNVRKNVPLVPSMTNIVTVSYVADAQLAVGASAAMVNLPDEGEKLASISNAFYFNLGTFSTELAATISRTIRVLKNEKKNWVLDPVGIGMGGLRTDTLMMLREFPPQIIRGNASEIIALANLWGLHTGTAAADIKGVDSTADTKSARQSAILLAQHIKGAVAVSGDVDLITDGKVVYWVAGGSELFTKIAGSGCALGGVIAAYAAVDCNPLIAALTGSVVFKTAGIRAAKQADSPASFKIAFLDELYRLAANDAITMPFVEEDA